MTEKAVRDKSAELVIVAGDASHNTKKLFRNVCHTHQVICIEYGTKEDLGRAIGKEIRASVGVVDEGFAKAIKKELEQQKD